MVRHLFFALFMLLVATAPAREKPEDWLEVRTVNFVVISNANQKQAQGVADQLERMRAVFKTAFPRVQADSSSPITVIAVKNEKDFRALQPEEYLAKGQLKLAGFFLRAADNNFVLLRLDAVSEHPYATVYHEYTHFLTRKAGEWMPLWLNEGVAEFYQNTEIRDKDAVLGAPSAQNLYLLRENRLLPLETLFAVDRTSPYYHEQTKASIFYAQSWALTHYLIVKDHREKTDKIREYMELVARKVDPVAAATRAFGDLKGLQKVLENYVRQSMFGALKVPGRVTTSDVEFKVRPLTFAQAAAVRAEYLAYIERAADARALLEAVLREEPNNVSAHETMGYLEYRRGNMEEARKWYEKAVKLDSRSYLAHYYFGTIAMSGEHLEAEDETRVETSFRTAIKLNPSFAPAYDRLAVFFGMRQKNLEEAHMLSLQAMAIDPMNVVYWLNSANILMASRRAKDAVTVIRNALKVAETPEDIAQVKSALQMAEQYQAAQADFEQQTLAASQEDGFTNVKSAKEEALAEGKAELSPHGPRRAVTGTIKEVQCSPPARMEFKLHTNEGTVAVQADNYYKVRFSAVGFTPTGELMPCTDLDGKAARVEFVELSGKKSQIISIELRK